MWLSLWQCPPSDGDSETYCFTAQPTLAEQPCWLSLIENEGSHKQEWHIIEKRSHKIKLPSWENKVEHLGTINKINIKNSTDELNRWDIIKEKICEIDYRSQLSRRQHEDKKKEVRERWDYEN